MVNKHNHLLFWDIFMGLNLIAIGVFIGVLVWAAFDLHGRITYVLFAQGPPLVMMGIRRIFR